MDRPLAWCAVREHSAGLVRAEERRHVRPVYELKGSARTQKTLETVDFTGRILKIGVVRRHFLKIFLMFFKISDLH